MVHRRQFIAATAAATAAFAVLAVSPAFAADEKPFDRKAFEAAQASGKHILVAVHADWCPVCKKQKPILGALEKKKPYDGFAVFVVDFDTQKDVLAAFRVNKQSTLISFRGKVEKARSVGATDPAKIEDILKAAI